MVDEKDNPRPDEFKLVSFSHTDEGDDEIAESKSPTSTSIIALELESWTDARAALARLEAHLESSKEDVRRAVDYARELEIECDRLAELSQQKNRDIAQIQSDLDEERGRSEELREQYEFIVARLEEMSGLRGRYHLERGRREQSETRNEELRRENEAMRRQLDALTEALEEARQQGFRAELGPLTIEIKSS